MPWLALFVKVCSSGVPHFSKYRIKKSNCGGEEAETFQHKLKGIAHVPRHEHTFLAGIPGLERRRLSRVGARIGCKDGFVLGDLLFESCLRAPSDSYLLLQQARKATWS